MSQLPRTLLRPEQWCLPSVIYAAIILSYIVYIVFKGRGDAKDKAYKILQQLIVAFLVLIVMLYACEAGMAWIPWMMLIIRVVWMSGISAGLSVCKEQKK